MQLAVRYILPSFHYRVRDAECLARFNSNADEPLKAYLIKASLTRRPACALNAGERRDPSAAAWLVRKLFSFRHLTVAC